MCSLLLVAVRSIVPVSEFLCRHRRESTGGSFDRHISPEKWLRCVSNTVRSRFSSRAERFNAPCSIFQEHSQFSMDAGRSLSAKVPCAPVFQHSIFFYPRGSALRLNARLHRLLFISRTSSPGGRSRTLTSMFAFSAYEKRIDRYLKITDFYIYDAFSHKVK